MYKKVLVIGKYGKGKSSFINDIVVKEVCDIHCGNCGTGDNKEIDFPEYFGMKGCFIDTIGLSYMNNSSLKFIKTSTTVTNSSLDLILVFIDEEIQDIYKGIINDCLSVAPTIVIFSEMDHLRINHLNIFKRDYNKEFELNKNYGGYYLIKNRDRHKCPICNKYSLVVNSTGVGELCMICDFHNETENDDRCPKICYLCKDIADRNNNVFKCKRCNIEKKSYEAYGQDILVDKIIQLLNK